jgi:hypothetical protein
MLASEKLTSVPSNRCTVLAPNVAASHYKQQVRRRRHRTTRCRLQEHQTIRILQASSCLPIRAGGAGHVSDPENSGEHVSGVVRWAHSNPWDPSSPNSSDCHTVWRMPSCRAPSRSSCQRSICNGMRALAVQGEHMVSSNPTFEEHTICPRTPLCRHGLPPCASE